MTIDKTIGNYFFKMMDYEYKDNIIELLKCVTLKTESSNYCEDFGIGTYTRVAELKVLIDEHFKRNKNTVHKLKPYPDYNS